MGATAGIVLAGGRSSRMGTAKAGLEWHGSTLLRRVTGLVARAVDGPVIVVRAAGQELPELAAGIEIVDDEHEGLGPVQGLAAGLRAIGNRAAVAYLSSTDVPLLHPAFVARVTGAMGDDDEIVLPQVGGHCQPLAAAYRTSVLGLVDELVAAGRLRPGFVFQRCRVRALDERALLADPALARLDPELSSVVNLNERADYERARALAAPEVAIELLGAPAAPTGARPATDAAPRLITATRSMTARAATLGAAAAAVGVAFTGQVAAALNGAPVDRDPQLPLVAGDTVAFRAAAPRD